MSCLFCLKNIEDSFFIKFNKMPQQLPVDCLNQIIEYYDNYSKENEKSLFSCLLVNRLWCQVSVRILWKTVRNYKTLIDCLPNESKKILDENQIETSTTPPLFHYVTFIKTLSIHETYKKIQNLHHDKSIFVTREVFKMVMDQISLMQDLDLKIDHYEGKSV